MKTRMHKFFGLKM